MEHIKQDKIINVPNALTLVRILLLPVVVWRFVLGDDGLIVYMTAMLTDALDGIIARKTNQITALGKLLIPLRISSLWSRCWGCLFRRARFRCGCLPSSCLRKS
ncbi:MAG: CDP-alcohol phosphatidyltransferase family protein [Christensenellales bacterium]